MRDGVFTSPSPDLRRLAQSARALVCRERIAQALINAELWAGVDPLLPMPKLRRRIFPGRKPLWDWLHQVLLARLRVAEKRDFSCAVAGSSSVPAVHGEKSWTEPNRSRQGGLEAPPPQRCARRSAEHHSHRGEPPRCYQLLSLVDAHAGSDPSSEARAVPPCEFLLDQLFESSQCPQLGGKALRERTSLQQLDPAWTFAVHPALGSAPRPPSQ